MRHLEPRQAGHLDVQKQHIGRDPFHDPDRFEPVTGLANDLDAGYLLEHVNQLFSCELLIVYDHGF